MEAADAELDDLFAQAALDAALWPRAIRALADATGAWQGELVGIGDPRFQAFNIGADLPAQVWVDYAGIRGGDPAVSWRVAAAVRGRTMQVMHEAHYDAVRPRLRNRDYDDFVHAYGNVQGCQTVLMQRDGLLVGLAMLRRERDGRTTEAQLARFARAIPAVRAAVATSAMLDHEGALLVAGALEAMSAAAFVCDDGGEVRALTPAGEALLRQGRGLRVDGGRLAATDPADAARLAAAFAAAADGQARTGALKVGRGPRLQLQVSALPRRRWTLSGRTQVLVVAGDAPAATVDLSGYGLTPAETAVASALLRGERRDAIATARGVSAGTLRTQVKSMFRKVGVHREAEFVARLLARQ